MIKKEAQTLSGRFKVECIDKYTVQIEVDNKSYRLSY